MQLQRISLSPSRLLIAINPSIMFGSLQEYDSDEASPASYAEVERFQGKVVYNLDGKAYIIDADNELSLQLSDSSIKGESNDAFAHRLTIT